jgi:alkylated DNA repair protein (DNA oxidative demethylase)
VTPAGFRLHPAYLDADAQRALARAVLEAAVAAPFYRPVTPGGAAMSVEMTNLGPLRLWAELADAATPPDACLVNLYRIGGRMGLHQDRDEADFSLPVLSVSLGDTAIFRLGGVERRAPTRTVRLASGDVCILSGEARLAFHGVDRIVAGSSRLVPGGGRINLTLRRARPR